MTLTPTQREILAAAADRPGHSLVPLPERLTGGSVKKVIDALLARGFAETGPEGAVRATEAGLIALAGVDPQRDQRGQEPRENGRQARTMREGTKQAALIAMLRTEGGATLAEMAEATGWAAHTVRGALSGALKKRLGLEVRSEKIDDRGRVYFLDA